MKTADLYFKDSQTVIESMAAVAYEFCKKQRLADRWEKMKEAVEVQILKKQDERWARERNSRV
jgi:hypothetical protein